MDYVKYIRSYIGNRPMFLVGAGTIIKNEASEILLIKRTDNNCWGLPGGSCELGETFEEAAIREAYEEAGLVVSNLKLFNVFSGEEMHFTYPNGDEVYNAVCIFETTDYSGEPAHDEHESSAVKFFDADDLPENMHPPDYKIIKKYLSNEVLK